VSGRGTVIAAGNVNYVRLEDITDTQNVIKFENDSRKHTNGLYKYNRNEHIHVDVCQSITEMFEDNANKVPRESAEWRTWDDDKFFSAIRLCLGINKLGKHVVSVTLAKNIQGQIKAWEPCSAVSDTAGQAHCRQLLRNISKDSETLTTAEKKTLAHDVIGVLQSKLAGKHWGRIIATRLGQLKAKFHTIAEVEIELRSIYTTICRVANEAAEFGLLSGTTSDVEQKQQHDKKGGKGGSHSKFGGAPPASRFEKKRKHAVPDHDSGNDEILAATEEAAGKANLCNGCGRAHARPG
jgi:hypothetical protein